MSKKKHKRSKQPAVSVKMLYNLLDALDAHIFVCDLETDEIFFVNDKMKERFHLSGNVVGQFCYNVINTCMNERCEFCVKRELLENRDDTSELITKVCLQGIHYKKVDRIIEWVGGKKAHLQYFIDISDLKTAEIERKGRLVSENKLRRMSAIVDSSPQYITYIDSKGNFDYLNSAASEITGYSHDEMMRGGVSMVFGKETSRHIYEDIIPELKEKERLIFELPLVRADGEIRTLLFSSFVIESDEDGFGAIARDITEERQMEKQLQLAYELNVKATKKLDRLINTAPVVYGLSIDGIVLEANEYAKTHLGMKPGDKTMSFYVHPEERDAIFAHTDTTSVSGVVSLYLQIGGSHRFFVNYSTLKHGESEACILWAVDIEYSELQKDQLRQTQQNLQTVLDFLPVPITIIDANEGHLIYANKRTAELFGVVSLEDVYGHHVKEFMPALQPDGSDSFEKTLILDSETPMSVELICLKPDGETFDALITACLIDYKGKQASLNIIQDMTVEKEYQAMLRNTAEKEREANRAKSEFLSRMSHEIRTPLNAITGMTTIAKSSKVSEKAPYYFGKIEEASKHLLDIINDILDMSKIESGKLELAYTVIDVRKMLRKIENIIRFRAESKEQILTICVQEDVPSAIMGDELRLTQVVTNLLSNANKFTQEGGTITLTVKGQSSRDGMCTLQFAVQDNGIGIDRNQYTRLFSAFEQANSNISHIYGGTGLGLAISRQLVEMMGGKIWVESELGKGSTFTFTIEAEISNLYLSNEKLVEALPVTADVFTGHTILLVEDVEINREIIKALLEDTGITIVSSKDGLEAVEAFKKNPGLYCLILMDIQMPEMDGYEATYNIRSIPDEAAKSVPIIAMTANVFKEDIDKCLSAGMNDHIGKPIDPDDLLQKIRKYLY